MLNRTAIVVASVLGVVVAGCGDDPISVSAPIGINLKLEKGDVKTNNVFAIEKGITTESGNPWGAFISDVENQLGGPASDIELDRLELSLGTSSTGVVALNQVFAGAVDVQFEMNDTNNFFDVATGTVGVNTEGRNLDLATSFNFSSYQATDLTKLLGGSFKVVLGGTAEPGFGAIDAKADLQLTFYFSAYE